MVCQDGFITSHALEDMELIDDKEVKQFVGEYNPDEYLLNAGKHLSKGPYDTSAYYMEHKRQQAQSMINAKKVIMDVAKEFEEMTGRKYGLVEEYKLDDADFAVVVINSTAGTAKDVVDKLRQRGKKAGLLKIRVFRPFPFDEIVQALHNTKAVAVMDRCEGFSSCGGPLFSEVKGALYHHIKRPLIVNFIYGIGGRDVRYEDIEKVYKDLEEITVTGDTGNAYRYLSLRE